MSTQPMHEAPDADFRTRDIEIEANAETLVRMLKKGEVRGFTLVCDEAERGGGDSAAPSPLSYFTLAIGF